MARPAEFERETVLREVMNIFWRKGYQATSIKDVVDATQMQPGSIYLAFGNKQKLFLEAIHCYFTDIEQIAISTLHAQQPLAIRLTLFFTKMAEKTRAKQTGNSCLLINTLLEMNEHDAEISVTVHEMLQQIEVLFVSALEKAKITGELPANKVPEHIAKLLMVNMLGLRVYGKTNPDPQAIKYVIEDLIAAICR